MRVHPPSRRAALWGWLLLAAATAGLSACDSSSPASGRTASCDTVVTAYGAAVRVSAGRAGCREARVVIRHWLGHAQRGTPPPDPVAGYSCRVARRGGVSEVVHCARDGDQVGFTRLVTPAQLPQPRLYSRRSPFNRRVGRRPRIDPRSGPMVRRLAREVEDGGATVTWRRWTVPVYFARARTRGRRVPLTAWWRLARALERVPLPPYAAPDPAGDGHLAVLDARRGCEYDLYDVRRKRGRFRAQWGAALPLRGTGVYPRGLSARGSGFGLLAGLVWPHELARGRIGHALIFSYPGPKAGGPVAPATESDGQSREAGAVPEGARVQLDPTLDLDALGLEGYERAVARALQEYGAYLADVGGRGLTFYAVHPMSARTNPYAGLLPDVTYPPLSRIPFDRLRVLRAGPQRHRPLRLPRNRCARYDPLRR